ncbi:MAG: hypothetical protein CML13_00150 [Puniceicoccaceae bacterium]|nr:hypothetical protein [Puniceicoccaceae bacterium]|tara:strand:- start:562 stop:1050 length:489 start_codon:yes stop_codon:yes gene_type:complete
MNKLVYVLAFLSLITSCSHSRDLCRFDGSSFISVIFGGDSDFAKVFHPTSLKRIQQDGDEKYLTRYYIQQPKAVLYERLGPYRLKDLKVWVEEAERREWDDAIIDEIGATLEVDPINISVSNVVLADEFGNEVNFRHYMACFEGKLMVLAVNPEKHQNVAVP